MASSKVPQFGGWNGAAGESVGYTAYFETARKGKAGAGGTSPIRNPNEMFLNREVESSPPRPAAAASKQPQPKEPRFGAWNDNEGGDSIPYTAYFENTAKDKARTNNNNPNEPRMNRDNYMARTNNNNPNEPRMNPQQQQPPKFGDWNNDGNEPDSGVYSAYFENPNKKSPPPPTTQMNRDMTPAARPTSRPDPNQPPLPQQQQQPKFGDWTEEAPYTAYFDNTAAKKDKVQAAAAPTSSTEPQMNRDMPVNNNNAPSRTAGRVDPRANEPQPAAYGGGRRGGGRQQQVQFAGASRSSAEPSPVHPRATAGGAGRGGSGSGSSHNNNYGGQPKKSPLHHQAPHGPSVPEFGKWTENENYTEVFENFKNGGDAAANNNNPNNNQHRRTPPRNHHQPEKQPKCGFLSWLCP